MNVGDLIPIGGKINGSIVTTAKYEENIERGDLITARYPLVTVYNDSWWDNKAYNVFSRNGNYMVSYKYSASRLEFYSVSGGAKTLIASPTDIISNDVSMASKLKVCNSGVAYGISTSLLFRNNIKVPVDILPSGTEGVIAFDDMGDWLYVPHTASPFLSVYKWDGSKYKKILNLDELPISSCSSVVFSNDHIYVGHNSAMKLLVYKKEGDNLIKKPINVTGYGAYQHINLATNGDYLAAANGQSHTSTTANIVLYRLDAAGIPIESKSGSPITRSFVDMNYSGLLSMYYENTILISDVPRAFESGGQGSVAMSGVINAAGMYPAIDKKGNKLVLTVTGVSNNKVIDLEMYAKKRSKFSYDTESTTMGIGVARDKGLINETKEISLFLRRD